MEPAQRGRYGSAPYLLGPRTVGWAMIGAGRTAAPRFVAALRALPPRRDDGTVQARVVGIHSRDASLARHFAETNQIAHATASLAELIERRDVHCVYVANHPRHHASTVLDALRAGKHVLCEPPLAHSSDESLELRHAALDRGLTLGLNYQHRLDPALNVARHRIAEGELGELVAGHASILPLLTPLDIERRMDSAWGGILFDTVLRLIDALRFVSSQRIGEVAAIGGPALLGERAAADLHGFFSLVQSGAIVHGHASYQVAHGHSHLDWIGTRQSLIIDPLRSDRTSGLALHGKGLPRHDTLPDVDLWAQAILSFHTAIAGEFDAPATAADDAANLCVVDALARALQSGTRTSVGYPHELTGIA